MGPLVTIALDVPRRLARSKILWALVIIIGILLVCGAAAFGFGHDEKGDFMTMYGREFIRPKPTDAETFKQEFATAYLTVLFARVLASYLGVFTGLLLLADAVPSAFAPGAAEVTLPKPLARGSIVIARHVGALLVAGGLALFLVGGAVAIVYVRTGVFAPVVLATIPVALLEFAVLHAVGTISSVLFQNAFLGALASAFVWGASWLTGTVGEMFPAPEGTRNVQLPILQLAGQVSRIAHRVLPRANDLPDLVERIPTRHFGTLPGGTTFELELIVQALVWTGLALGVATVIVRERDY